TASGSLYFWSVPPGVTSVDKGHVLEIVAAPKGAVLVNLKVVTADWDKKAFLTRFGTVSFVIGDVPVPPVPPGPDPPVPPVPPVPPTPVGGLRVLIVHESSQAIPSKQQVILGSVPLRQYVASKGAKSPDGKADGFRIYDPNAPPDRDYVEWAKMFQRPRASLPWIVIAGADGVPVFEGALPGGIEDAMKLLAKFGG
ncbi:MAG: hypothetical protein H7210_01090, partial [Pyrinomonadaceae bacterium]|nr:hypothetical protein [Phycisphaerales bacterium]